MPYEETQELLRSVGIDPLAVPRDGLRYGGYEIFQHLTEEQEGDQPVLESGMRPRWYRRWPKGVPVGRIIAVWRHEGGGN